MASPSHSSSPCRLAKWAKAVKARGSLLSPSERASCRRTTDESSSASCSASASSFSLSPNRRSARRSACRRTPGSPWPSAAASVLSLSRPRPSSVYSVLTAAAVSSVGRAILGSRAPRSSSMRRAVWRRQWRGLASSRASAALLSLARFGDCGSGMSSCASRQIRPWSLPSASPYCCCK